MIDPTRPLQKTLSIDLPATNQRSGAEAHPTRADLPLLVQCTLCTWAASKETAVAEAKRGIDRILAPVRRH
jgi:hypothetical protein